LDTGIELWGLGMQQYLIDDLDAETLHAEKGRKEKFVEIIHQLMTRKEDKR
jgi:hypothetical protein